MKWTDNGNEIEEIYKSIKEKKKYIWGAGTVGGELINDIKIDISIEGFVDNSIHKQKEGFLLYPVFSMEELLQKGERCLVIIAIQDPLIIEEIQEQIKKYDENKLCIIMGRKDFVGLYYCFMRNQMYIQSINVSVTQKCTLNCEKCSILTPLIPNKKHYSLENLKKDIDYFFAKVDILELFGIVGGEPFLYPDLEEYIDYTMKKYRKKIKKQWTIVTNGTVIPNDTLLECISKYQGQVVISDYSATLPEMKGKISTLLTVLDDKEVAYAVSKTDSWIDFGYTKEVKNNSDEDMANFFEACKMPCRLLLNGKLYYCANAQFAVMAGITKEDAKNTFDLISFDQNEKSLLLGFDQGYNALGYVDLCRQCNGFVGMNHNYVPVAKQVGRESQRG